METDVYVLRVLSFTFVFNSVRSVLGKLYGVNSFAYDTASQQFYDLWISA